MAVPMSGRRLAEVLRAAGISVVEEPGWLTNNRNHRGAWGEVEGILHHHTVTSGDTAAQTRASVDLCFNGHSELPGPLCHGVITKAGTIHLVGNGRANHAGLGDEDVFRAMLAGRPLPRPDNNSRDGNRLLYGFESINRGDGKDPWPREQLRAMDLASAAICAEHDWPVTRSIFHLNWQSGKVDPRGIGTVTEHQARVRTRMTELPGGDGMALSTEDKTWITAQLNKVPRAVMAYTGPGRDQDIHQTIIDSATLAGRAADSGARAVELLGNLATVPTGDLQAIADAVVDELARRSAE